MADQNNLANGSKAASWINLLAGIWLILSPFMFSSLGSNSTALWTNIISGAVILLVAIVGIVDAAVSWSRNLNAVLGAWVFFSPFILAFSGLKAGLWNNIILGIIVFVAAVSGSSMASHPTDGRLQPR